MAIRITRLGRAFGVGAAVVLEADEGEPRPTRMLSSKAHAHRQRRNKAAKTSRRRNRRQRRRQRR